MRRGTTPTLKFHLPFDVSRIRDCEVYLAQNDELLVEKDMSDCVLEGDTLTTVLTQAETLRFDSEDSAKIEMQIRFVFTDGSVDATAIVKEKAKKILKDGEIHVD